ncbi:MAG: homoserine kinase [Candidatus Omnitrophica bacterium]|nr:homoserine kinase [Candidatus Omnitrophota bacterium]
MRSISVSVPATVTNLGSGFDSLGLALSIRNRFSVSLGGRGLSIRIAGEGENELPRNKSNLVYRAMNAVFRRAGRSTPRGLDLRLENNIPIGKGLGSSASCVVGGLALANELVKAKISERDLIRMAVEFEGHLDNILPAFVGGFTVAVLDGKEIYYARHVLNRSIHAVLMVPDGKVLTAKARQVLPKKVSFQDAVYNLSRAALSVSALTQENLPLLSVSMQDRLHEKYRRSLFPKISDFVRIAGNAGGFGCSVSGSGPAVITFANGSGSAERIAAKIRFDLRKRRLKAGVVVASITSEGKRIGR